MIISLSFLSLLLYSDRAVATVFPLNLTSLSAEKINSVLQKYKQEADIHAMLNEIHVNSNLEYNLLFVDPMLYPFLQNIFPEGDSRNKDVKGYFRPQELNEQIFTEKVLEGKPYKDQYSDLFKRLREGSTIGLMIIRDKSDGKSEKLFFRTEAARQEIFHALQYDYEKKYNYFRLKNASTELIDVAQEFESELVGLIVGVYNDSTRVPIKNIPNMDKLIAYFKNLQANQVLDEEQKKIFDEIFEKMWTEMKKLGYFPDIKVYPKVEIQDLQTLIRFYTKK